VIGSPPFGFLPGFSDLGCENLEQAECGFAENLSQYRSYKLPQPSMPSFTTGRKCLSIRKTMLFKRVRGNVKAAEDSVSFARGIGVSHHPLSPVLCDYYWRGAAQ